MLLKESFISEEELTKAQELSKELKIPLIDVLIDQGLLTQKLYEEALAEYFKMPFYDLVSAPPSPEIIGLLPEEVAQNYSAVVVKKDGNSVTIATADPGNETLEEAIRLNLEQESVVLPEEKKEVPSSAKATEGKKEEKDTQESESEPEPEPDTKETKPKESIFKKELSFSFKKKKKAETERTKFTGKITFVYAPKAAINAAFKHYNKPLATRFQQIIKEQGKVAPEILEEILDDAIQLRASDIHFEPQEKIVIVRFRVDGVMHEAGRIPREHYDGVLNRIKIDSNMRIDEHFAAQDGAIRHKTHTGVLDIRVSVVPLVDGEKVVMRLLSEYVRHLTLHDLGFTQANIEILERAAHKPFGMILTTGPTGSGKSTTLYALLKLRNSPDVNISTIEDPVEYKIAGINHIQVNNKADLTFASGLRALVRQDPDVLLVGEIRDGETADISVNAALTGHLLFSTLHANDAATAVPRLLDMGVEPFLLASTLEVIIGQRLVRRICPQCRYSYKVPDGEADTLFRGAEKFFKGSAPATLYKGKGCDACGGTGYRGRVGIYELLEITSEVEELIINRATSAEINDHATKSGMKLMFEDGFEKVLTGMTTIEELMRVAAPPDIVLSTNKEDGEEE